jgi:peptide deformylase
MIKFITMIRNIVQIGEDVLNQKCEIIKDFNSPEIKQLAEDLIDTADNQRKITAGLAAPQIGVPLAMCVCRRVDLETKDKEQMQKNDLWEVMINPEIIKESRDTSTFWEACMSVGTGKNSLFGPVERPETVTVNYFSLDGKQKSISASDFFSHEIQHEIDHLNGILFLKYVTNPQNIWKRSAIDAYYKEFTDYPPVV